MANLKVNFAFGTKEKFDALPQKDADTLYVVSQYPETGKQGVLYCNSTDKSVKFWTGAAYQTVVPPIVTTIDGSSTNEQLAGAKAVKDYVDQQITDANGKVTETVKKVDTLIGADANKSVRAIANEELAAQLIPETADESLNTLKEIADWIQKHPDDASKMNASIAKLEGILAGIGGGGEKGYCCRLCNRRNRCTEDWRLCKGCRSDRSGYSR